MSLLTLDTTGTPITVRVTSAGHAEPRVVGERRYTFYGRERSFERAELMVVPLVLYELDATAARAIRLLFARGAQVTCTGDVFNNAGADVRYSGEITDEMIPGDPLGYWTLSLTLTEVSNAGTVSGL